MQRTKYENLFPDLVGDIPAAASPRWVPPSLALSYVSLRFKKKKKKKKNPLPEKDNPTPPISVNSSRRDALNSLPTPHPTQEKDTNLWILNPKLLLKKMQAIIEDFKKTFESPTWGSNPQPPAP